MMTEPRLSPVVAGAEVVLVAVAGAPKENGLAEAAGFPNPKPVETEVVAGVPEKRDSFHLDNRFLRNLIKLFLIDCQIVTTCQFELVHRMCFDLHDSELTQSKESLLVSLLEM